MKHTRKILVALLILMTLLMSLVVVAIPASAETTKTVYFTNSNGWSNVYAYAWYGSSSTTLGAWPGTKMTYVETNDMKQDIYAIEVPTNSTKIIFNNGSGTQSADTTISSTANGYYPNSSSGGFSCGTYTYSPAVFYVAGTKGLCSADWNAKIDAMTHNGNGSHTITFKNVPAGKYEYKVTNGTWDKSWPGQNKSFTTTAVSNVTITFNAKTQSVSHSIHYHSYVGSVTTQPGCESLGVKTYICSCGDTYTENIVSLGGHTAGAAATCTTAQTCTVCGTELVAKLGHNLVDVAGKDATCTEPGYTAYKDCSRCDYIEGKTATPATGHTNGAAATCTTAQTCTVCGTELVAKLGHNLVDVAGKDATCTEPGYTAYKDCSRCDYIEGKTATSATGHTAGAAATCTTAQTCTVCGTELEKALGHNLVDVAGKDATCTESGYTAYKDCSRCDYIEGKTATPATSHSFNEGICGTCGAEDPDYVAPVITKEITFEFGANGSATHKDGTTDKTTYTETNDIYTLSITSASKFYPSSYDAKGNSCIKLGSSSAAGKFSFVVPEDVTKVIINIAGYKADAAKIKVNGVSYTISKLSNNGEYIAIEVDTTTTKTVTFTTVSGGYRAMINSIVYVATLGGSQEPVCEHKNTTAIGTHKEATCTEAGITAGVKCADCGETITAQETISATGHNIVDGACTKCDYESPTVGDNITVTTNVATYATNNGWKNESKYSSINMDSVIDVTVSGTTNTGKYYTNGTNWRIYQSENATITVKAADGYTIVSVKFTYSVANTGYLFFNGTQVKTGTVVAINSDSATFNAGNTGTATNGQVRFTEIEVVYAKSSGAECTHENTTTTVTKEATCTNTGTTQITCKTCGVTVGGDIIPVLGHNYVDGVCSRCENELPEKVIFDIAPKGEAKDADGNSITSIKTYTENNYNLIFTPSGKVYTAARDVKGNVCIKLGSASEVGSINFTVPNEVIYVVVNVAGYKANDVTIKINGVTYEITTHGNDGEYTAITIDTTENKTVTVETTTDGYRAMIDSIVYGFKQCTHANTTTTTVNATCTVAGSTTVVCDDCGETVSTTEIPATGHTKGAAATCTTAQECTVCHIELEKALGHNLDAGTETTAPTCTAAGVLTKSCSRCSYTETSAIAALGHNLVDVAGKDATCTEPGYTVYKDCSRCDHIEGKTEIPATGHTAGAATKENENAPTCTVDGSYENVVKCSVCGGEISRNTVTVPATGHTWVKGEVVAATCTEDGYTNYACSCGATKTDDVVPATGHATEVEYWSYNNKLYYVPVCGCLTEKVLIDTTNALPVTNESDLVYLLTHGFNVILDADINLTATIDIEGAIVTLDLNGKTLKADWESDGVVEVIHVHDASHLTIVGEGNVISGGQYTAGTNSVISCRVYSMLTIKGGNYYSASHGDVIFCETSSIVRIEGGHFEAAESYYGNWYVLDIDENETYNRGQFIVTGGTFVNFDPANHTNDGDYTNKLADGYHSIGNNGVYTVGTHSYNAVVTAPDCANGGYTLHSCACGDSYKTDETAALGHRYNSVVTPPTFGAQGYTTHTCSSCGDSYVDTYVDAKVSAGKISYRGYVNDSSDREGIAFDLENVAAGNSVVIKTYDANGNLLTTTTLKAGGVEAASYTCNIVLWGKASSSWETVISAEKLTVANMPATAELWCDGVLVDSFENALGAGTNVDQTDNYVALDCVYKAAKVGNSFYASIQDAVNAAAAGDTVVVIANVSGEAVVVDKNLVITGASVARSTITLTNVSINANGADSLTVSALNFEGNSWINSGTAEELIVSGVNANVTPSNTAQTNSRSAFISLGRSEAQTLALTVENCSIVSAGGSDPILGWAAITEANLSGNTFGSASAYQNNSDSVKFMSIADGAVLNFTNNTVYSNYNGIVLAQNTTRGNSYTANFDGNTFVGAADHIWIEVSGSNTYNGNVNVSSDNTVNGNEVTASDIKLHPNLNNFTGYAGVDVVLNNEGKVIGGSMSFVADDVVADGFELDENGDIVEIPAVVVSYVAFIDGVGYESLADALAAASAMSGDVVVEIYDKVTLAQSLTGSYDSISFVGKDTDAEIYLDVQGYVEAAGKKVYFTDLTLSKVAGGYVANAGFMNLAFGIFNTEVTYTNCVFANGAYASGGKATFVDCTFYRSHDRYGMWVYGDVECIVDNCTFADIRGIKLYSEGLLTVGELTVKNTDFSQADNKPAIVLTSGKSVTLEGNTYSAKGVFELDLDGVPNGTSVTSDVPPTCVNDNGACGVLVDGKIYTTVAQAAAVATSGSTVTLLHNSTETVEFSIGVNLDKNGYTADGVTVKVPNYVAQVGDTQYESVIEALLAAIESGASEVKILKSVREVMPTDIELIANADLLITADEAVEIKFYNVGTSYDFVINSNNYNTITIGENVTFQLEDRVIWLGYYGNNVTVVVNGTLAGYQIWHGADTIVNATGTLKTTGEALVMRRGATLTVDGGKVEANYFNILAGNIFAENATITCGALWIDNNGGYVAEGNVSINLWDSTLTSSGNLKSSSSHTAGVYIDVYNSVVKFNDYDGYGACQLDANTSLDVDGENSELTVKNLVNNGTIEIYDCGTLNVTGDLTVNAGAAVNLDGGKLVVLGTTTTNKNLFIGGESTVQIENLSGRATVEDDTTLIDSYIKSVSNGTTRVLGDLTIKGGFSAAYFMTAGSTTSTSDYEGTITIDTTLNVSYGFEMNGNVTLDGGLVKLSGGNANGAIWGMVFQSGSFVINSDIEVVGNSGSYAPIHFTAATVTVNGNISHSISGGEPIYVGGGSNVTFAEGSVITTECSVHVNGNLISAADVNGKITKAADTATIVINGGTYTQDVTDWCEDGYDCISNGDGTYSVAPHVHTEAIVPAVAPTCTETGLTEGKICIACGETLVEQQVASALGHDMLIDSAVAPTCTETGLTEGSHCSRCDHKIAQEIVAALGHSYNAVVTAPDCVNGGYTTYTCSACGDTYVTDETAALGHNYNAVVTAPTFDAQGYTTHTCSACGDSYVDSYVAALVAVAQIGSNRYETITEAINASVDGDVIKLLALTITEEVIISDNINRFGGKNITIEGAANFGTTLTGGLTIGYDDSRSYNGSVTIKGVAFEGKGLKLINLDNVSVLDCKFTNLDNSQTAIYVISDGSTVLTTITGNIIDGAYMGIRVRNALGLLIDGNEISNTQHNGILAEQGYNANNYPLTITNNTLENWGLCGEGRAIRAALGKLALTRSGSANTAKNVTIANNTLKNENAPEEFIKMTDVDSSMEVTINTNILIGNVPAGSEFILLEGNGAADVDTTNNPNVAENEPHILDGTWWIGSTNTGVNATGNGIDGVELNADGELIINFTDGTVINLGNIKGEAGNGIASVDIINNELVITYTNGTVVNLGNIKGEQGEQGETGNGIAKVEIINNELVITYTDGTVINLGNIKGEQGEQGETGNGIASVDIINNELVITYTNGTVVNLGNIKGEQGEQGETGNGIAKVEIINNELVITYTDGTVINLGNIKGEQGIPGTPGNDGRGIANVTITEDGQLVITYTDGTEVNLGNIKGEKGEQGATGNGIERIERTESDELIIYFTDGTNINLGSIKGNKGDKGDDGKGIASIGYNENGELVITYTDGTEVNLGNIKGDKGDDGKGIAKIERDENDNLIITYTDNTTTNLGNIKGEAGNGIAKVELNENSELVITYTNGTVINLGSLKGDKGEPGKDGEDGKDGQDGKDGKDGAANTEIVVLCIGIATLCLITTMVALVTRKYRSQWWILN